MESSILSQSDINYYMQQSKGKLNMIICGMTELLSDNDRKIERLETQTWYQRMALHTYRKEQDDKARNRKKS